MLLVENHEPFLALFHEFFTLAGYRVLIASSGAEALAVFDVHGSSIDLLVSEVVLGDFHGFDLAKRVTSKLPSIPVLLMSGAPRDEVLKCGDINAVAGFLRKPFPLDALLQQVQSVLKPAAPDPALDLAHQQRSQFRNSGSRQLCRSVNTKAARRVPTEQDIEDAIGLWQLHSGAEGEDSKCHSEDCFCCELVNGLLDNSPFLTVLRSIVDQLQTSEASQLDALLSAYAFGLLTADVMRERGSASAHYLSHPTISINGKTAGLEDGAAASAGSK